MTSLPSGTDVAMTR